MANKIREFFGLPTVYVGEPPRVPTDEERKQWLENGSRRPRISSVRKELRRRNPVRWRRLHSDLRWMERQLASMNLNPEDARWYL